VDDTDAQLRPTAIYRTATIIFIPSNHPPIPGPQGSKHGGHHQHDIQEEEGKKQRIDHVSRGYP
jgi:hypothetical protein